MDVQVEELFRDRTAGLDTSVSVESQFLGPQLTRREVVSRLIKVLRARKFWIMGTFLLVVLDLFLAEFFNYWPQHSVVAALFTSGLVLLLTLWIVDDLADYRNQVRWGLASSMACRSISTEVRRACGVLERTVSESRKAESPIGDETESDSSSDPADPLDAIWRDDPLDFLRKLKEDKLYEFMDRVVQSWGAIVVTVPENADWLTLASLIRYRLFDLASMFDEMADYAMSGKWPEVEIEKLKIRAQACRSEINQASAVLENFEKETMELATVRDSGKLTMRWLRNEVANG